MKKIIEDKVPRGKQWLLKTKKGVKRFWTQDARHFYNMGREIPSNDLKSQGV